MTRARLSTRTIRIVGADFRRICCDVVNPRTVYLTLLDDGFDGMTYAIATHRARYWILGRSVSGAVGLRIRTETLARCYGSLADEAVASSGIVMATRDTFAIR